MLQVKEKVFGNAVFEIIDNQAKIRQERLTGGPRDYGQGS